MVGCLVDFLVAWLLVGCLVSSLVGWLGVWLVGWLVSVLVGQELCVGSHLQAEFAQCLLRLKQRMKGDLEGEKAKWVCYVGV